MSRPDEGLIHQWLDGECTPEESAALERLVATDPAWAAAVAEARGLMAASSRILGALDAVPHARPQQANAPQANAPQAPATHEAAAASTRDGAPVALRTRSRAPQRWLGLAATLALVAGTAYVLRDRAQAPFVPAATVATDDAAAAPVASPVTDPRAIVPPSDVPPLGPVRTAERVLGAAERDAGATQPVPSVREPLVPVVPSASTAPVASAPAASPAPAAPVATAPAVTMPRAAVPAMEKALAEAEAREAEVREAERRRATDATRGQSISDAPRGAVTRRATLAAPPAPSPAPLPRLEGCWRVSAPPELVGVLEAPEIRRAVGDTLVLVTPRGDVRVLRQGGTLRGGLEALQVPCGAQD